MIQKPSVTAGTFAKMCPARSFTIFFLPAGFTVEAMGTGSDVADADLPQHPPRANARPAPGRDAGR